MLDKLDDMHEINVTNNVYQILLPIDLNLMY